MRYLAAILIAAIPLLLAARSEPPAVEQPETTPRRNFTIRGASLSLIPGESESYMRFSGGVSCVTENMELSADELELELQTAEVTGGGGFALPQSEVPPDRLVEDPGSAVRSMAAEMQVPTARFDASAIRRVGASGDVRISASGFNLVTAELVSTDGGRSWAASGRSTLSSSDDAGNRYTVTADNILYDMPAGRALARGNISGEYAGGEAGEPVKLSAERVELDIARSLISASEFLEISYRGYQLCCGSLTADIAAQQVSAGDNPQLLEQESGLNATAARIDLDLETLQLHATGGIRVEDPRRGIELTAGELSADLENNRMVASGSPHLQQGDSTFDGERITVFEEDGKTVIEVDGPQRARLDVDELDTGKEQGPPAQEEPPVDSN